jgi:hypothetical protein
MRPVAIACLFALLASAEAVAGNCRHFSWSIGRPIDLFDEPLPTVTTGQSLPKEGLFALILSPVGDVIYPMVPERGSDGSWGGVIIIESVAAGRYQVALSEDAWVEASQENLRLQVAKSGRSNECRGVHHSVEFEARGEPLTLQIGGASVRRLHIAVVRVWPFEWRW